MWFDSLPIKNSKSECEIYGDRLSRVSISERPFSWNRDERLKHWLSGKERDHELQGSRASKLDELFVADIRSLFSQSYKRLIIQKSAHDQIKELCDFIEHQNKSMNKIYKRLNVTERKVYKLQEQLKSFTFEYLVELESF